MLKPIYQQIGESIENELHKGSWQPFQQLPTENEFAHQFGVSRMTVRKGLDILVEKNLLMRKQGKGIFVNPDNTKKMQGSNSGEIIFFLMNRNVLHPHYAKILKGIETQAAKRMKTVIYSSLMFDGGVDGRGKAKTILDAKKLDGIVVTGKMYLSDIQYLKTMTEKLVVLGELIEKADPVQEGFTQITHDMEKAGYFSVEYLVNMGHEHIGLLNAPLWIFPAQLEKGFKQAIKNFSLKADSRFIISGLNVELESREAFFAAKSLFFQDRYPTAIVAWNDAFALQAIQAVMSLGFHVPEDVSILGMGNWETSVSTGITTMDFCQKHCGEMAVEMICKEETLLPGKTIVPVKLIPRATTKIKQEMGKATITREVKLGRRIIQKDGNTG